MKVLVAGGAGFIGSHLADALLAQGHQVTAVDNLLTGNRSNLAHLDANPDFRFLLHDVVEPLPFGSGYDAIFHLASPASPVGYGRYPLETLQTNAVGTRYLLELATRSSAKFLLTSTSEVYGDPLVHPQPETYWGNVNPVGPHSCYDEGKRFAEALTVNYAQQKGVDVRIVRIFNTYGPRNDPNDGRVMPNFMTQALTGAPLTVYGDGKQTRSFCYVSDLVAGLMAAMFGEGTRDEVINLGNPEEFTMRELAELVVKLTDSRSTITHLEARQEEIAQRRPDISKAKKLLGWEPHVSLAEGVAITAQWLRTQLALEPSVAGSAAP